MHVAKVVDLFAKISEQLSLHFSDFSTIFKRIYNFAVFQNKRKRKRDLASRPLERFGGSQTCPWPALEQRRRRRWRFPARELAGGEGKWGKGKREARATHKGSCRGRGRPGAGRATEQWLAGGGELRRRRSGVGGRARTGRGGSLDHDEAILGGRFGSRRAEEGVRR